MEDVDVSNSQQRAASILNVILMFVAMSVMTAGMQIATDSTAGRARTAIARLFSVLLQKMPLEDAGIRFHLGKPEILMLIAALAPLALLVPAILAFLSCFALSFKEAQSYSLFLVLPVAFTGVISSFYSLSGKTWLAFASDVMAGRTPPPLLLIGAAIESAIIAAIFLRMAARLFTTEKIIFGH